MLTQVKERLPTQVPRYLWDRLPPTAYRLRGCPGRRKEHRSQALWLLGELSRFHAKSVYKQGDKPTYLPGQPTTSTTTLQLARVPTALPLQHLFGN